MPIMPFGFSGYGEKRYDYSKIFDVELITSLEDTFLIILRNFLKYAPEEFDQLVKEIKESIDKEESSENKEDSVS